MSDNPDKVQVEVEEVKEEKSEPVLEPESVLEPEVKEEVKEEKQEVKEDSEKEVPETAEVVKNVKEMLSSTEGKSGGDLENRVKVLEERLEKLLKLLSTASLGAIAKCNILYL